MTAPTFPAVSRRTLLASAGLGATLGVLSAPVLAKPMAATAPDRHSAFALIADGKPATVHVDANADTAVRRVAASFADDLERVSGTRPALVEGHGADLRGTVVIIGVLGQSPVIDGLVQAGLIDPSDIRGEWEAFRQIVVDQPLPGVPRALVIVGADRRGAVFGTYDISERIGVSPWHWFADVAVRRQRDVLIPAGSRRDQPKVRYRGFFINDEDPCLKSWAIMAFGGVNSAMYAHVFEVLLRMKGNFLWPAMWGKAFADDDPNSMVLADAMGVVMGNSHHEPMLRAQMEWHRHQDGGVTGGAWDYDSNGKNLRTFWRGGIERMMSKGDGRGYESVVTVGMRGDGDEAMAEGTATDLLERIVTDQRRIIADVTGKPASETPQLWALYKEVQDYYDHGMKVPDDVTLLFSDDNWGQIRRLPDLAAAPRRGGYGIYYHFDYVGGPRNYKWINTNQIEKTWQQMDLAYRSGVKSIWIVNVGDIKPMEYPLGFFLKHAWDPEAMTPEALAAYPRTWAAATFGPEQAGAIGEMMTAYSQYTARRKPELTNETSFALGGITPEGLDGGEFGDIMAEWDALEARMLGIRTRLSATSLDAYYQLIEFPIAAMANLYRMYYGTAWNRLLASGNDSRANYFADQVETAFRRDGDLTRRYHSINGGKWNGMMLQVHMNYVIWNDPTQQTMPSIMRVGADTPEDQRRVAPKFVARPAVPDGIVAVEAAAFSRVTDRDGLRWTTIAHLGRTGGAMAVLPQGHGPSVPGAGPAIEYDVMVRKAGAGKLTLYLNPTLATTARAGGRIAVSLDGGRVQTLQAVLDPGGGHNTVARQAWATAVSDNVIRLSANFPAIASGRHTVKIWRIDDNMVLQKIVLATMPETPSYLGSRT